MSFAKTAGLAAGFLGAFGVGVLVGPMITDRHSEAPPAAVAQPNPEPTTAPVTAPAPKVRAKRAERTDVGTKPAVAAVPAATAAVAPATHPELQQRLKPVLNRGANMDKAADGFRNAEEFAAVAHAARNTQLPFMLLKHRVLEERMSLDAAIRASKPDIDAAAEATKARTEARADVNALQS